MLFLIHALPWRALDPARHPFELERLRPLVTAVVTEAAAGTSPTGGPGGKPGARLDRAQCELVLDRALVAHAGPWIAGWNWAASEPGGGGPVHAWCCARDSILRKGEKELAPTIERVLAAVREWRAFLDVVARTQTELEAACRGLAPEEAIERAAVRYAALVLEYTAAEDAWYATFECALRWHLEAQGLADGRLAGAIGAVVRGQFASWIAPADEAVRAVGTELGLRLCELATAPAPVEDALTKWRAVRRKARFGQVAEPAASALTPVDDAERRFIDRHDARVSSERARRLHAALTFMRAHAAAPLDWKLLAAAQCLVLGGDGVAFRTRDAFAKGGRERYGLAPDTGAQFEHCLAQSNDATPGVLGRAARAYLDVCFFHPFEDGNGRAARLALAHVLGRAGLGLHAVEPIFVVPRAAADPDGPFQLELALARLVGRRVVRARPVATPC